ncbi:hypothetical protein [Nodularia sp. NIES-3585]|uniref:hypothetical protein n=1 Tax=Nodularia sp. NIES-3585 TaxID=1973477 RepID=UPI000B5CD64A|nr:hypothetical protein [Nodularia sp. NIES-3585]GAX36540.1 hypothetical protein NIES3585_25740 [Nodularia sp. NIES-3585]
MDNKAKSIIHIQPDGQSELGLMTKSKKVVEKVAEQTPSIIFGGIVALALLAGVAIYGLSVIKYSDCGGSLRFKSSQSSQEFQFRKEVCKQNPT